ncbi:MAG: hypothetical protein ABI919_03070 [Ramlibacter sp.]
MATTTHSARITGPVPYRIGDGVPRTIPLGPCLVEQGDGPLADVVWGETGQNSAAIATGALTAARDSGHLLLLD